MTKFIRLKLNKLNEIRVIEDVSIIHFDYEKHQKIIPIIYSYSFNDKPWENGWEKVKYFDPNGVFLIRNNLNNKLTGFIISFEKKDYCYISVLAVLPEYRNRGYAKLLLQKSVQYLRSKANKDIYIDVDVEKQNVKDFYTTLGFEPLISN